MIEVRTPCRLHFGLLAYGATAARQFGGVGVMVREPDIAVRVRAADQFGATGPMRDKALQFAQHVARLSGYDEPVHVDVLRGPRPHTGLGTGTQLGMAIARAIGALHGREAMTAPQLAAWSGRGARSAIGAHGFIHGGLIVEGGKADPDALSPLLMHAAFPSDWRIVTITPRDLVGLSDKREVEAFSGLPAIPESATAAMCKLVLLGLVPALRERNLADFGEALYELQQIVGHCFAPAQGGVYADPQLAAIAHFARQRTPGVGQSSWGPTLYAVTHAADAADLAAAVRQRFDLGEGEVAVTEADNQGGVVSPCAETVNR